MNDIKSYVTCANSSIYSEHVAGQNANEMFNEERTMGGQLVSAVEKLKTKESSRGLFGQSTERSDESSKMVYSDTET